VKILGIDPGSRATGYAVLELSSTGVAFLEGGVLPMAPGSPFTERLGAIGEGLELLVGRCRPDESAVEDLFHALNSRSALRLAHARGVILGVLARARLPISEYTPLQVKKAVSGYGFAETRDASDAVAVALCHAQALPLRRAVTAAEKTPAQKYAPGRRGGFR